MAKRGPKKQQPWTQWLNRWKFVFAGAFIALAGIAGFVRRSFETQDVAGIAVTFVVATAVVVLVAVMVRRWWSRRYWLNSVEMAEIDRMTGREFEETCAEIFRRLGYTVEVTQTTRDHGADLVLQRRSDRIVVQTKRQEGRVGNSAVQEIVAAKAYYKANRAMVITNSSFAPPAVTLAEPNGVELVDRTELARLLAKATRNESDAKNASSTQQPPI